MVMGEVDIGLRTSTIPPITQTRSLECQLDPLLLLLFTKVFMLMREADIGLRTDKLLPITTLENKVPNQGTLKIYSLGVVK